MTFEAIAPRKGYSNTRTPVTVAWRVNAGRKSEVLHINIRKGVAASIALAPGMKAHVARDRPLGLLRIRPARPDEPGWAVGWKAGGSTGARIIVPLEGVKASPRGSSNAIHTIEGGALVITLPEWAAPERAAIERAAMAANEARRRMQAA